MRDRERGWELEGREGKDKVEGGERRRKRERSGR